MTDINQNLNNLMAYQNLLNYNKTKGNKSEDYNGDGVVDKKDKELLENLEAEGIKITKKDGGGLKISKEAKAKLAEKVKGLTNADNYKTTFDVSGDGAFNINDLIVVNKGINLINKKGEANQSKINKLDKNGDLFKALDISGDGQITIEELNFFKSQAEKMVKKLGTNANGDNKKGDINDYIALKQSVGKFSGDMKTQVETIIKKFEDKGFKQVTEEVKDAKGNTKTVTRYSKTTTAKDGTVTTTVYNKKSQKLSKSITKDGKTTDYKYDKTTGNKTEKTVTQGDKTTTYKYDKTTGNKTEKTVTEGNNKTVYKYYNDGKTVNTKTVYDTSGETPVTKVETTYNKKGKPTKIDDKVNNKTIDYTYDTNDATKLSKKTVTKGNIVTTYDYDTETGKKVTKTVENKEKNTKTVTEYKDNEPEAGQKTVTSTYYKDNKETGIVKTKVYGANNQIISSTREVAGKGKTVYENKDGNVTFTSYEADGTVKEQADVTYGKNEQGEKTQTFTYKNADGQETGKVKVRTYNADGTIKSTTVSNNGKVSSSYEYHYENGAQTSTDITFYEEDGETVKEQRTIKYNENEQGEKTQTTTYKDAEGKETGKVRERVYNADGTIKSTTVSVDNKVRTQITYNDGIKTIVKFKYDGDGNAYHKEITTINPNGSKTVETIKRSNEDKTKFTKTIMQYDENGNETSRTTVECADIDGKETEETPAEEPQEQTPAEEPQEQTPAEEPQEQTPAEEPQEETPAEEPQEENEDEDEDEN